jgi:putative aldouronate transport system substrate-binding protein
MRKEKTTIIFISLILITILITSYIFTGCAQQNKPDTPDERGQTSKTETQSAHDKAPDKIRIFMQTGGQALPPDFSHKDNDFMKRICEWTNVEIVEIEVPVYADTKTKFNLMISSGNIPDLVHRADITEMRYYGRQGAFLDLKDIIENHPNISKKYNAVQINSITEGDGKVYIIPSQPTTIDGWHMAVRFDLLEDVGYSKAPSTLDQWVDAMKKLKDKRPESIPYTSMGIDKYHDFVFRPFGCVSSGWQYSDKEEKFFNVLENPLLKDAIVFGRGLIRDGIWEKEFITNTQQDYEIKRLKSNVMINPQNTATTIGWIKRFGDDAQTNARFMIAPWPIIDDERIEPRNTTQNPMLMGGHCIAISAQTKVKDAAVRFIEVLLSDDVKELFVYGREGIEYTTANGERKVDVKKASETAWRSMYGFMFNYNPRHRLEYNRDVYIDNLDIDEANKKKYRDDWINNFFNIVYPKEYEKVGYHPSNFMVEPSDNIRNRTNEAIPAQKSLILKALMDEITLEEFEIQASELIKKYQDITEDMNKRLIDAKPMMDVK